MHVNIIYGYEFNINFKYLNKKQARAYQCIVNPIQKTTLETKEKDIQV